jgi:hypothetical protein
MNKDTVEVGSEAADTPAEEEAQKAKKEAETQYQKTYHERHKQQLALLSSEVDECTVAVI